MDIRNLQPYFSNTFPELVNGSDNCVCPYVSFIIGWIVTNTSQNLNTDSTLICMSLQECALLKYVDYGHFHRSKT